MNSLSKRRIDEYDFDRRLKAFASIDEKYLSDLPENQMVLLLHNLLFFLTDEGTYHQVIIPSLLQFIFRSFNSK